MKITLADKEIVVDITERATRALTARNAPLFIEMELLFSCLIRKRVHVSDTSFGDNFSANVLPKLTVSFRPVMTKKCDMSTLRGEQELLDFPITNAAAFVPKWLRIDYQKGQWQGEFGY